MSKGKAISKKALANLIYSGTFEDRINTLLENFNRTDKSGKALLTQKQEVEILEAIYKAGDEEKSVSAYRWIKAHEISMRYIHKSLLYQSIDFNDVVSKLHSLSIMFLSYTLTNRDTKELERKLAELGGNLEVRTYNIKQVIEGWRVFLRSIGMEQYLWDAVKRIETQTSTATKALEYACIIIGAKCDKDICYFHSYDKITIREEHILDIVQNTLKYVDLIIEK